MAELCDRGCRVGMTGKGSRMRRVCRLTVALALTALMVFWGGPARADISLASNSPLTLGNLVFTVSSCTISGTAVTCGDLKLAPHGPQGVIIEASSASQIFSVDCTSSCVSA